MIYVYDEFFDHPKTIAAGGEATLVYLQGLAWLKRQRSEDGRIPKHVLGRLAPTIKGKPARPGPLAKVLVQVGLWEDEGGDFWTCHDYIEHNSASIRESQRQSEKARQRWSKEAAKKAAQDPETPGNTGSLTEDDVCPGTCHGIATADATASVRHMQQSTVHSPQSTVHPAVVSSSSSRFDLRDAHGQVKCGTAEAEDQPQPPGLTIRSLGVDDTPLPDAPKAPTPTAQPVPREVRATLAAAKQARYPEDHGRDGWGNPEATGPNENPDTKLRRRALAIRWRDVLHDRGGPDDLLGCNRVVALLLHEVDARIIDEQIGWQADATDPPRTPTVLADAVRRITR